MFWPRGASGLVGDNLADAFRAGASYLTEAVSWVLGDRQHRPEHTAAAMAADIRLDDAVRGYLTEQGSKRVSKADLWVLVMAAMRLRLIAHSMLRPPSPARPHEDDRQLLGALAQEAGELAGFYDRVAAMVARPDRSARVPPPVPPPEGRYTTTPLSRYGDDTAFRSDALWVGHHLEELAGHVADIIGPARRLASVRRRPWWR